MPPYDLLHVKEQATPTCMPPKSVLDGKQGIMDWF